MLMVYILSCDSDAGRRLCTGVSQSKEHASEELLCHPSCAGKDNSLFIWPLFCQFSYIL